MIAHSRHADIFLEQPNSNEVHVFIISKQSKKV